MKNQKNKSENLREHHLRFKKIRRIKRVQLLEKKRKNVRLNCLVNDTLCDMLTRIRNAQYAKHKHVYVFNTKTNKQISEILLKHGFIKNYIITVDKTELNNGATKQNSSQSLTNSSQSLTNSSVAFKGKNNAGSSNKSNSNSNLNLNQESSQSLENSSKFTTNSKESTKDSLKNEKSVTFVRKTSAIKLELKYVTQSKTPVISNIKALRKPGLRLYAGYKDIPKIFNGMGLMIINTSKGIVTDQEARRKKLGGEILCSIY